MQIWGFFNYVTPDEAASGFAQDDGLFPLS